MSPKIGRRDLTVTLIVAGAPRSGKSTVLRAIHDRMAPDRRGPVMPIGAGQTPLLDWLPIDLGTISGWEVRLNLYAVPPLTGVDATRRLILADTDGVLFVADSQAHRIDENLAALQGILGELVDSGENPRKLPMAFLYSKQDLPSELVFPREVLDDLMNFHGTPSFAADALRGGGVLEALHAVVGPMLRGIATPATLASATS